MKYIIGTKIKVARPRIRIGMSSSSQPQNRSPYQSLFVPDVTYTLINIRKKDGQYIYRFISDTKNEVTVVFPEIQIADQFISTVLA